MSPAKDVPPKVYLLALDDAGAPDIVGPYINLPAPQTPYVLRFAIQGASSICREGSLWINMPEAEEHFDRDRFREFKSVFPFIPSLDYQVACNWRPRCAVAVRSFTITA